MAAHLFYTLRNEVRPYRFSVAPLSLFYRLDASAVCATQTGFTHLLALGVPLPVACFGFQTQQLQTKRSEVLHRTQTVSALRLVFICSRTCGCAGGSNDLGGNGRECAFPCVCVTSRSLAAFVSC